MLYTHLLYHNDSIIIKTDAHGNKGRRIKTQEGRCRKTSLQLYFTSHFIARVRKGCSRVCMWEGAGDRTWTSYFDPTVMTVTLCLSCSLRCLTRGLGVHCWMLAFFMASYQHLLWTPNSIGGFRGPPRSGVAFPTTSGLYCLEFCWQLLWDPNSTPTRSPTGSLKSNV